MSILCENLQKAKSSRRRVAQGEAGVGYDEAVNKDSRTSAILPDPFPGIIRVMRGKTLSDRDGDGS